MNLKTAISILALLVSLASFGQATVNLFAVEGEMNTGTGWMPYYTFNNENEFDSSNALLRFNVGDSVQFIIHNHCDLSVGFGIDGFDTLASIDSAMVDTLLVVFPEAGVFIYEDPFHHHRSAGLAGMIVVSDFVGPEYFGLYAEHSKNWMTLIKAGDPVTEDDYYIDAFTINGLGFPETMEDSTSYIRGHVGDTIRIYMANAGFMYHFPHFHGYHVTILNASKTPRYTGWSKDSMGMIPMETMTLELVPDKPGKFPMHNHNLVTTTFGGNYPGGMMMHMEIDP